MENQVQGGNRRASFHQSTLSSEDMLGLLAPVDSNILVLDSQRRHRNTSLNSLKRLLELSKHNKVLTEAFYDVSLQKGGFCSIKFLQAWVLGCLCKARQKLASFRDTYVPHAFAVMDELDISYPEDARCYVKNLTHTLGAKHERDREWQESQCRELGECSERENSTLSWRNVSRNLESQVTFLSCKISIVVLSATESLFGLATPLSLSAQQGLMLNLHRNHDRFMSASVWTYDAI